MRADTGRGFWPPLPPHRVANWVAARIGAVRWRCGALAVRCRGGAVPWRCSAVAAALCGAAHRCANEMIGEIAMWEIMVDDAF